MRLLHVKLSSCSFAGPFFVAVFADSASMPLTGLVTLVLSVPRHLIPWIFGRYM